MKKTLMIRKPLPPFTEQALLRTCPTCGYRPKGAQQGLRASFDGLQVVAFLVVLCFRCGAIVGRYGPVNS